MKCSTFPVVENRSGNAQVPVAAMPFMIDASNGAHLAGVLQIMRLRLIYAGL